MKTLFAIIGVISIVLFAWIYFSSNDPSTEDQPSKLDNCLLNADKEFEQVLEINSTESTENVGARTWRSKESKDTAYDRLDADRKLCLDLYKD